ncbi:MAG: hypothetical protein ABH846_04245 [Patescibacteria group bacterium]
MFRFRLVEWCYTSKLCYEEGPGSAQSVDQDRSDRVIWNGSAKSIDDLTQEFFVDQGCVLIDRDREKPFIGDNEYTYRLEELIDGE